MDASVRWHDGEVVRREWESPALRPRGPAVAGKTEMLTMTVRQRIKPQNEERRTQRRALLQCRDADRGEQTIRLQREVQADLALAATRRELPLLHGAHGRL